MIFGDTLLFANLALIPDNASIIQSTNLYNYCGSNPLSFIDLTGQIFSKPLAIVGGIVGGVAGAARGVVRGAVAGESVGTIIARGAVGAVSGAAGGAAAGAVFGATASFTLAGAAGGATYGALYGAGNAIIDGVNSGQSAREIARSAGGAFLRDGFSGLAIGGALGTGVGSLKMGLGAVAWNTLYRGPLIGAGAFTGIQIGLGIWEGDSDRIREVVRDSFSGGMGDILARTFPLSNRVWQGLDQRFGITDRIRDRVCDLIEEWRDSLNRDTECPN